MSQGPITTENDTDTSVDAGAEARLRASASHLFATKGYEGATVRAIIEGAGVTRPVLYYYFRNKEDLFCRLVRDTFDQANQDIDLIIETIPGCRDRLQQLAAQSLKGAQEEPDLVRLLLRYFFAPPDQSMAIDTEQLTQGRFNRICRIMQEGIDNGELQPGLTEQYALLFSGLVDMHVMSFVGPNEREFPPDTVQQIVHTFFEGLGVSDVSNKDMRST